MSPVFERMSDEHRTQVIDIFNYYIENGYAAFPETAVPYEFYNVFLMMTKGYPAFVVKDEKGGVDGFGFLRAYNPLPAFRASAEVTCFLRPGAVRGGIGSSLLRQLEKEAAGMGIRVILACISSLNEPSIRFHQKNGFDECGRFRGVGRKRNTVFDLVWMQGQVRP
jgi:L-amino acid N-acyltransferase YncA